MKLFVSSVPLPSSTWLADKDIVDLSNRLWAFKNASDDKSLCTFRVMCSRTIIFVRTFCHLPVIYMFVDNCKWYIHYSWVARRWKKCAPSVQPRSYRLYRKVTSQLLFLKFQKLKKFFSRVVSFFNGITVIAQSVNSCPVVWHSRIIDQLFHMWINGFKLTAKFILNWFIFFFVKRAGVLQRWLFK